jgi:hypothetical protein
MLYQAVGGVNRSLVAHQWDCVLATDYSPSVVKVMTSNAMDTDPDLLNDDLSSAMSTETPFHPRFSARCASHL